MKYKVTMAAYDDIEGILSEGWWMEDYRFKNIELAIEHVRECMVDYIQPGWTKIQLRSRDDILKDLRTSEFTEVAYMEVPYGDRIYFNVYKKQPKKK